MKLELSHSHALLDEVITTRVTDVPPGATVYLNVTAPAPGTGEVWGSRGVYKADAKGTVDLHRDAAQATSSYQGVDPMGPYWSMSAVAPKGPTHFGILAREPVRFSVSASLDDSASGGRPGAEATLTRTVRADDVVVTDVRSEKGITGTLFAKRGAKKQPTVIVLGGSGGGIGLEPVSALLASRGFTAFSLGYFQCEGLAPDLRDFPLEYFALGIQWLQSREEVDPERIGMTGWSKGAEATLLLATMFPEIRCIVPNVGTSMVFGVRTIEDESAGPWSYRGVTLPYVPLAKMPADAGRDKDHPMPVTENFRRAMRDNPELVKKATIPAEKIKAPILMLSAEADGTWPSFELTKLAIQRLDDLKHATPYKHISYPGASHSLALPYMPTTQNLTMHNGRWLTLGGTPAMSAAAKEAAWKDLTGWFRQHLV